ncbi:response regulator transcription factor [Chengkuizengella axinellae]|uniref:Response regulator transcription factor n=1 Tax=Chengkuizengella axinellae TaxID=3064388 RepID=A0ABT9J4Q5_9BACL|nr:response regulator transcription factor [Chengkuizengella sp. 2205SS18-9]MDP5276463.1 response regulator transcription factor [Chengkuizengella sp. 2205SS18-9]
MNMYSILVVEDDHEIRELICEFLQTQEYKVMSAKDGFEGFKLFQQNDFDLVMMDVMMPKMDGFQLCQLIRQNSDIPMIMLTALEDDVDQIRGFDLGIDDYITKPFSFQVLIKRVEAVLRRKRHAQKNEHTKLSFKELVLDVDSMEVYEENEPVELTMKEFDLLQILLKNRGKVIPRETLIDNLWGYNYYGDTRVVDTHIKNIRRKLKGDYIKTVKGVGYKIYE